MAKKLDRQDALHEWRKACAANPGKTFVVAKAGSINAPYWYVKEVV